MDRLGKDVVHEICTNQVVVTLQACVKELVENALDANATRIEVRLRESGSELLEVVDNGRGIGSDDHCKVAQRHATSKIREYDDLNQTLTTFGFRGEALSAICAMGDMTVSTRTAEDASAWLLSYDRFGKLTSSVPAAREVGTTVSVREVFKRLPVRHKEFLRNAKAQVSATLRLIQSYAIAQPEIRFHVVAEKVRGNGAGRATLLTTSGSARGWKEAVAAVLGDAAVADVRPLELQSATGWHISGLISSPHGGRRSRDSQLFYVNRRPIDPPKRISKLINDTYHQYNSRACPLVILSFTAGQGLVDVNVTPDKRTVFLHNEEALLADLQQGLTELYSSSASPGGPGASLSNFGIRAVAPARNAADDEAAGCSQGDNLAALAADASEGFLPVPASQPASQRMASPVLEAQTPEVGAASRRQVAFNGPETPEKAQAACVATSPEPVFEEAEASASGPSWRVFSAAPDEPAGELGFRITELSAPGASRGSLDLPRTSWPQPLKRRPSELSEMSQPSFRVIELVPEDSVMPPAVITEGLAEELGFKLIEEYLPQPRGSGDDEAMKNSEALQDDDVLMEDDAGQPTQALGCSFQASVPLAELGAAVARKRRRRQAALAAESPAQDMPPTASSPSVQFPNAFSLAALRPGAAGASSLNEVAKFATSGSPASSTVGNDGAGLRFDKSCFTQMQVIGQFNLGFIIAALRTDDDSKDERGQGRQGSAGPSGRGLQLFIIDQHASDEKFRFEALNRESKIDRQPLVSPHPLQLTPAQELMAESHLEVFRLNGFELHRDETKPPGRRLRIASLPTCRGLVFSEKDIHDLLYKLEEMEAVQTQPSTQDASAAARGSLLDLDNHRSLLSATAVPRPHKVWQLLASRACRGAIMIGKALRVGQMEKILANLGTLQQPWNCPHGRPTMRHLVDAGAARQAPRRVLPLARLLAQEAGQASALRH